MTIATGIAKQLRFKRETTWGTAAGASGGQLLRRTSSTLDLKKATYQSNEIRSDYQVSDFRHGVRSIDGDIAGELSPGTYSDFFAAALMQDFVAGATTGAQTTISASVTAPQFVRSAGNFITDGFKVGDVIRVSGFTAPAVANNAHNFLLTAVTATGLTGLFLDGGLAVAKAAGDSVTIAVFNKKTMVPQSGHTDVSYSIEHFYSDIAQSELMLGCKVSNIAVALPATGMATSTFTFMGRDYTTSTSAYYTSPAANTSTGVCAAVNGSLSVGGSQIALITGMTFSIARGMTTEPVVGSNVSPGIQRGRAVVTGQLTAFFQDGTLRDYFVNETDNVSISAAFTTANTPTADFIAFNMPRCKINGTGKDDGEKGLVQTLPFQALLNGNGGTGASTDLTTFSMQDSQA